MVIGTMNNAGTVLLQIADMSIIEAEVEVDETDIPFVQIGQLAKVKIDAIPDKTFTGKVTEVGNSPIVQAAAGQTGQTATNFKVTVTIDGQIPEVRPGFTCTADVTTATRAKAVAVPIQAMAVRELIYDAAGKVVPQPKPDPKKPAPKVELDRSAARRPDAEGHRGRLPDQGGQGHVHPGQDRHRRRQVLRGAERPQGGRRGHHRPLQFGARLEGGRHREARGAEGPHLT